MFSSAYFLGSYSSCNWNLYLLTLPHRFYSANVVQAHLCCTNGFDFDASKCGQAGLDIKAGYSEGVLVVAVELRWGILYPLVSLSKAHWNDQNIHSHALSESSKKDSLLIRMIPKSLVTACLAFQASYVPTEQPTVEICGWKAASAGRSQNQAMSSDYSG